MLLQTVTVLLKLWITLKLPSLQVLVKQIFGFSGDWMTCNIITLPHSIYHKFVLFQYAHSLLYAEQYRTQSDAPLLP